MSPHSLPCQHSQVIKGDISAGIHPYAWIEFPWCKRRTLDAGKTTFVKHLLKREYPGIHIGPEPTTDRFVVVMSGMEERRTPGNTLIVQPDKPFQVHCYLTRPKRGALHPVCATQSTEKHMSASRSGRQCMAG